MKHEQPQEQFVIHDGPAFAWVQRAALIMLVGLIAVVIWSVVTPIDEVAKSRGALEPISQVRRVESLHGGQIEQVHVKLGQAVEKDDLLVTFDPIETTAAFGEARAKNAGLELEVERLTAYVEDRKPDFSAHMNEFPELIAKEDASLEAQKAFVASQRSVVALQISEKNAELEAIKAQRPELLNQIAAVESERNVQEDLVTRKLAVKALLVALQERESQYRFDLAKLGGREAIIGAEITELEASGDRILLEEIAKSRTRIVEAISELRALSARIENLESRMAQTEIRAPASGLIQTLPDETTGDVVDPGGLVATIVPIDGGVRFTGRIAPLDVAFVEVGQPVRLKIDSFNFGRYGALDGKIEEVSPTTLVDQRGTAYYEIEVTLAKTYFRDESDGLMVLPGMTGEADIITGSKTVFQYIWKPIYTNLDLALSER